MDFELIEIRLYLLSPQNEDGGFRPHHRSPLRPIDLPAEHAVQGQRKFLVHVRTANIPDSRPTADLVR